MSKEDIGFICSDRNSDVYLERKIIEKIYDKINDDVSKKIFLNRLLFSLSGEHRCMKNVILSTKEGRQFINDINEKQDKELYIYGAGVRGKRLVEMLPEKKWCGFIDSNKCGMYRGLPIINWNNFDNWSNVAIIVSNRNGYKEVVSMLEQRNIDKKDIVVLNNYDLEMAEDMYFEERCIGRGLNFNGAFIDAGCYDGDDTIRYIRKQKMKDFKVFAFEPDKRNFNICLKMLENYNNVSLYNIGLSDNKRVSSLSGGGEGVRLSDNGVDEIQVDFLDNVIKNEKVGFIKADVEGEEERLLRGASKIICEQKPVLAISIYHKKTDIWKIPQVLLELNPDYVFGLGHYTVSYGDTVLYAL